jgi:2-dehydropantoate 2-reductase
MRTLVVGAGATGGLFGGRLARAGRDVRFLVRPARAAQLRADGLRIRSPLGDFSLAPQIVEATTIGGPYDVILLGVKAHGLQAAIDHFAPAVGPGTMIVPMLNGMRHIDMLVDRFGDDAVLGGVCIVSTTLDEQGRIVQLNELQSLRYGERAGGISSRVLALDEMMQGAGFDAHASERIMQEMWEKWVFLAALGAATCLLRGPVGAIVAAGGASIASAMLDECASVARAAGFPPRESMLAEAHARITAAGSPLAPSMFRDMQQGRSVEAEQIVDDLIARGRLLGISTPFVDAAGVALRIYRHTLEQPA